MPRRAEPRGIFPLDELVTAPVVVVDTSAVVEALLQDQPKHAEYAAFFERLVDSPTTLAFCELLELEIVEAAVGIALRRRHKRWREHRRDGRSLRPARALQRSILLRWHQLLSATDHYRVPMSEEFAEGGPTVGSVAVGLTMQMPLRSYDAAHVATAFLLGAPIAARDIDFADVPGSILAIYTDSGRVATCRRRRGGRGV